MRPFLENVLRGRRVSPERIEEVAHHYERFGGVSPLTELTMQQARALEADLAARGLAAARPRRDAQLAPVSDRHADRDVAAAGIKRAIGILAAAQRSYSGCLQYKENVRDARSASAAAGVEPPEVVYVGDWHEHPGFIAANADHVQRAYAAAARRSPRSRRG